MFPEKSLIMAPLSGYTDLPFRRACRRYGCYYAFTPLVEAGAVVHASHRPRTESLLIRGEDEPWLGIQLLGSSPDRIGKAVRLLGARRYEVMDFNMGCPVRKVTGRGAGVALCYEPSLAVECLHAMMENTTLPVTAKIRIVTADDAESTVKLAVRLAEAGIQALTVHGRTREQVYSGAVASDVIRRVQEALRIPVIANGGVMDGETAAQLRISSGCSRLMVARGAIGNPWIFQQAAGGTEQWRGPSHEEICDEVERHVRGLVGLYGEYGGMRNARKIILAYLVGRGYRRHRRNQAKDLSTLSEFAGFMRGIRQEGPLGRVI
ncbi:MAG: tRNA-dihydrouridine synthase family protein [Candidatus Pacebacteria bacterium]|nr:tRNA-dihydrouridine synthase family protein [Candidatus Paceibacterota bacterium]